MKILSTFTSTRVTLELTTDDHRELNRIIESLYIVLNEGEYESAFSNGNLTTADMVAAREGIELLVGIRDVIGDD